MVICMNTQKEQEVIKNNWENYIGIEEGIKGRSLTESEMRQLRVRFDKYFLFKVNPLLV